MSGAGGTSATGGTSGAGGTSTADAGMDAPSNGGTGGGGPVSSPSCAGLPANCGPSQTDSCCTTISVPGGSFNRYGFATLPVTVSDYALDKYEVTVGRFRAFVNAGMGTQAIPPAAGAGVHPLIAGTGWNSGWNAALAADTAALKAALLCNSPQPTWTDGAGGKENFPINCITWFEAFAFCAWDGGRLATEAEWEYAATGGSEMRAYPWGSTVPKANADLAVYGCYYNSSSPASCNMAPVGSVPAGNARWGHADLAGNMWEWVLDWYDLYYGPCVNCANTTSVFRRSIHGGSFADVLPQAGGGAMAATYLLVSARDAMPPEYRGDFIGPRCARIVR